MEMTTTRDSASRERDAGRQDDAERERRLDEAYVRFRANLAQVRARKGTDADPSVRFQRALRELEASYRQPPEVIYLPTMTERAVANVAETIREFRRWRAQRRAPRPPADRAGS
jgi:hypothetical protein